MNNKNNTLSEQFQNQIEKSYHDFFKSNNPTENNKFLVKEKNIAKHNSQILNWKESNTIPNQIPGMNSGAPEGKVIPTLLPILKI